MYIPFFHLPKTSVTPSLYFAPSPMAAISPISLLLLFFASGVISGDPTTTPLTSLYLSPKTLFSNYDKMLSSFKIFIYAPPSSAGDTVFTTAPESQFYSSLRRSQFVTEDPSQAHLFFVPFPSSISTRNLARLIKNIRVDYPFWNRTLGADHFYLSTAGVGSLSDRNIVELKKNSIQISCFPATSGLFIPHKDITLPPVHQFQVTSPANSTPEFLGYMELTDGSPFEGFNGDPAFKVELGKSIKRGDFMKSSRFCLFDYAGDLTWMVEAMAFRCVPVVITDRPIQDLPLMDVIKWSEMALFVAARGGADGLRQVLDGIDKNRYDEMVESGVAAIQHLVWNAEPQAHDAFNMILYQLWLRRHTIRYARWVEQ